MLSRTTAASRRLISSTSRSAAARAATHDPTRLVPKQYLRHAAVANYDPSTHQRTNVSYDEHSGRPLAKDDISSKSNVYKVQSWRYLNESSDDGIGGKRLEILWGDGCRSTYPMSWVEEQSKRYVSGDALPSTSDTVYKTTQRVPWSNLVEDDLRSKDSSMSLTFDEIVRHSDASREPGMDKAIEILYKYGFLLVTSTPINDGGFGVAALAAAVSGGDVKSSSKTSLLARYREIQNGTDNCNERIATVLPDGTDGPLRTLYGNIWSTHSSGMTEGQSMADSAYGCAGLPLHTDMTYLRDPPGCQIFTMKQPAVTGGESIFADGFAVAERLRLDQPEAFHILCSTKRTYRSICTETGWHLEGSGPVISAIDKGHALPHELRWGRIKSIRHNDLDRLPDLPPLGLDGRPMEEEAEINQFYDKLNEAHRHWDSLLGSDEFRLVLSLMPGDTVVVANQRCFHGRYGFQTSQNTSRIVMGCYVSQEDLDSRFRRAGYALPK